MANAWSHIRQSDDDPIVEALLDRQARFDEDLETLRYVFAKRRRARAIQPSVEHIEVVLEDDLKRRAFLRAGVALGLTALAGGAASNVSRPRVTYADVQSIQSLTDTFRRLDSSHGGGQVRSLADTYLDQTVMPMLRHGLYSVDVGQRLSAAASKLAHLTAWTAYDEGDHQAAKKHLQDALTLATAAGDQAFAGEVLAGMSHHAVHLRDATLCLDTARAAQRCAATVGIPSLLAEAHVMEAHAHALRRESKQAAQALHLSVATLDSATDSNTPVWLSYFDESYLAARAAHCFYDLAQWTECEAYAHEALRMNEGLGRARVSNTVIRAHAVINSDIDHACALGREALGAAEQLRSGRTMQYITDLQRHLTSEHSHEPAVQQFNELVSTTMGGTTH